MNLRSLPAALALSSALGLASLAVVASPAEAASRHGGGGHGGGFHGGGFHGGGFHGGGHFAGGYHGYRGYAHNWGGRRYYGGGYYGGPYYGYGGGWGCNPVAAVLNPWACGLCSLKHTASCEVRQPRLRGIEDFVDAPGAAPARIRVSSVIPPWGVLAPTPSPKIGKIPIHPKFVARLPPAA